jgi:hypothetical protein
VSAVWVAIALLSLVVLVNAVVSVALARQVGVLHLRVRPLPSTRVAYGPEIGAPIALDGFADVAAAGGPDRIVVGFISPNCGGCTALLPAFRALAAELPGNERLVLASEVEAERVRAYLAEHGVALPVLSDANALRGNLVPGTPFVAVTDGRGRVMAAGTVQNLEQVEFLLDQGRETHRSFQLADGPVAAVSV